MKNIEKYKSLNLYSEISIFEYLLNNLKKTIRTYDFFVAWEKVFANVAEIEISLNILNSLIGKDNLSKKLKDLIMQYPQVVSAIPLLIAVRDSKIKVAEIGGDISYSFVKKKEFSKDEIDGFVHFSKNSGLLKILADKSIKNLVDYAIGVEVGLDTNARKNRSGKTMENLIEVYIKSICEKCGCRYLRQATASKIKKVFDKTVLTDKADRHFDFVIDIGHKIYLIEVNYYASGGSKLKSVAGEFKSLYNLVNNANTQFIWITDGLGWNTAKKPLLETFQATDYVMNIKIIEDGLLEEIITEGL